MSYARKAGFHSALSTYPKLMESNKSKSSLETEENTKNKSKTKMKIEN